MAALSKKSDSNVITFVVGPTAAGKSKWALQKAIQNHGAIVNADSVQFYKKLNIGAAKPTAEEMKSCSHYLFDLVEPDEEFTAGDYRRSAMEVIESRLHHEPLYFVGGSGFYIQALEKGMFDVGKIPDEIRDLVEKIKSSEEVFQKLQEHDPHSASKIGKSDPYRLRRALSVVLATGKSMSEIESEFRSRVKGLGELYPLKKIGILMDRDKLRIRVKMRTQAMLKDGLIDEVKSLVDCGYSEAKSLRSVGYKEVLEYLKGQLSREELADAIVTSTMQLAKRQMTWFKRDKEIEWIEV